MTKQYELIIRSCRYNRERIRLSNNFVVFVTVVARGLGRKIAVVNLKKASSFAAFAVFF